MKSGKMREFFLHKEKTGGLKSYEFDIKNIDFKTIGGEVVTTVNIIFVLK